MYMLSQLMAICIWISFPFSEGNMKMYNKEYHSNGNLKAEGWVIEGQKTSYWYYYHTNGKIASKGHYKKNKKSEYWYYYNEDGALEKEGHYNQGIAENWWIFYDLATKDKRKIQYQKNQKNGFCLVYKGRKLIKVEKYIADEHKGEWKDLSSFRRDNPDVKLR